LPGLAFLPVGPTFNGLGDRLHDTLDPKLRQL
jgi:ABC-type dipeptide/oligopeptide/nickel transport system permease subunit